MYIVVRTEKEHWKDLEYKHVKPMYEISSYGRIRNKLTNKIMALSVSEKGYLMVGLMVTNKSRNKTFKVHRLVAFNFLELPNFNDGNTWTVNHLDGNKEDNSKYNLKWETFTENVRHSFKEKLNKPLRGSTNGNSKNKEEYIHDICKLISEDKKNKEIRSIIKEKYDKEPNKYLLHDLKRKKIWVHISDLYF